MYGAIVWSVEEFWIRMGVGEKAGTYLTEKASMGLIDWDASFSRTTLEYRLETCAATAREVVLPYIFEAAAEKGLIVNVSIVEKETQKGFNADTLGQLLPQVRVTVHVTF